MFECILLAKETIKLNFYAISHFKKSPTAPLFLLYPSPIMIDFAMKKVPCIYAKFLKKSRPTYPMRIVWFFEIRFLRSEAALLDRDDVAVGALDARTQPDQRLGPGALNELLPDVANGRSQSVYAPPHALLGGLIGRGRGSRLFRHCRNWWLAVVTVILLPQGLFLGTSLRTHTLTMSQDVTDIHGDRADFASGREVTCHFL